MKTPDFWYRPPGVLASLLSPAAWLYDRVSAAQRRSVNPWQAPVPVICIGNLTVGGAGKTPTALAVMQRLQQAGITAHFLSRGYGGRLAGPVRVTQDHQAADVGDEALLLAERAPCWIAKDRRAGAQAAIADGAAALVLDDGLQNPSLYKDLSLLVVDGYDGFGNGWVLPAGPLRQSVTAGLTQVQAVVLIGPDQTGVADRVQGLPILTAQPHITLPPICGPVLAFAGIGRPEKFFRACRQAGANLVRTVAFADHHPYGNDEVQAMLNWAKRTGATVLTTAKDAVRLPTPVREQVAVATLELNFEAPQALDRLLASILTARPHG